MAVDNKKNSLIALKKAQSSINKIIKMIEEDKYCIDILQQINAVNGLLKSASNKILENHLNTCFTEGMNHKDEVEKNKLVKEVLEVIKRGNNNG
jgi:DNA-binding FrmR family transcriptional regulator